MIHKPRQLLSVLLVVGSCFFLFFGGLTLYLREAVFDSEAFSDHATEALQDQDVRRVIGDKLVDAITAKGTSQIVSARPLISTLVEGALGTPAFLTVFRQAVDQVHATLFDSDRETIVLDLADAGGVIIAAARTFVPELAKELPPEIENGLIDLGDRTAFADTIAFAEGIRELGIVMPLLSLVGFMLAIGIARDRRKAIVNVGAGVTVTAVVAFVAYLAAGSLLFGRFSDDTQRGAVEAVWSAFFDGLENWILLVGVLGIVLAAAASTWLQPVDVVDRSGRFIELLSRSPVTRWGRLGRALAAIAIGLFIVLRPTLVVQIAAVVVGAYVLYFGVSELLRLIQPPVPDEDGTGEGTGIAHPMRRYALRLGGGLVGGFVALALLFTVILSGDDKPRHKTPINACNGYRLLCDRPLDKIVFPATHNAMSAAKQRGWYIANQNSPIVEQLNDGIRGLLIDVHYGVRDDDGKVRTNLDAEGQNKASVVKKIGPRAFAAAERLVGHVGVGTGQGTPGLYLCHTLCEIGNLPLVPELVKIRKWLEDHPNEVLMIFVEDYPKANEVAQAFEQAGLDKLAYAHEPATPFPTPRQMIRSGKRVVVLAEKNSDGVPPWYHDGFTLAQETPYDYTTVDDVEGARSCVPNRGGTTPPLFQLNNFIEKIPPSPGDSKRANEYDRLLERARRCQRIRERTANLIAVDFYEQGDLMRVARVLNGIPGDRRPVVATSR